MVQKNNVFILLLLTSALSVGLMSILLSTSKAQEGAQTFTATLEGSENKSNSTGTAKFQVNDNNSKISYWLNVTGIKKINEAHIHNGTSGQSGDIVVSLLSKSKSAKGGTSPPEIDFSGNITKGELRSLLEGKDIADLVSIMSNGSAYVNVHTDKYPRGAIRGQITSTSANTEASPGTNETTVTPSTTNETTVTPSTTNETTVTPSTTNETTVTPSTTNETTVTPSTTNETTVTPSTTNETTVTPSTTNETTVTPSTTNETTVTPSTTNETTVTPSTTNETTVTPSTTNETTVTPSTTNETTVTPPTTNETTSSASTEASTGANASNANNASNDCRGTFADTNAC